ncbi:MAG: SDR family NAD(P)-dependent oxidoreductase [Nanoarchaeota archaeon]|nr:SDR family NAD(P)-dependent oxidoreductase [Nanoarchaeota archaeon]
MEGEKILITGGLGFVGSNLAVRCLELGADVTLFDRSKRNIHNIQGVEDKVTIVQGDVAEYSDIEKAVLDKDIVFHLAGQTSNITSMEDPIGDIESNLVGTVNVLEACRRYNPSAKIIFAGTVTQLGIAKKLPINENMKDDPLSIYEANKVICEKYLQIYHRVHGLYTVSLRFATLFGDRQRLDSPRFGITNYFIGRIMKDEKIKVYGGGRFIRDYNYIGNVVDALLLASQNDSANGEFFLVGSNRRIYFVDMVREVIKAMEEVMQKKGTFEIVEFPEGHKQIDVGDTLVDNSKICTVLGWEPRISFEEGLRKTIRFYGNRYGDYLHE